MDDDLHVQPRWRLVVPGGAGNELGSQPPDRNIAPLGGRPQDVEGQGLSAPDLGHDDALSLLDHNHGLQPGRQLSERKP